VVLLQDYIDTFRQENSNVNHQFRYYVERGGNKYYLKALPNGDITTLAVSGSTTDRGTLFRHTIG